MARVAAGAKGGWIGSDSDRPSAIQLDSLTDDEESRAHFSAVFYTGLFAEHPLYRSLFPAGMESQGHRFFRAIEFVVKNLAQHRRIRKFLTQLGRDHRRYGVEREHYEAAGVALKRAVRSMYGTSAHSRYKWTPDLDEAWSQFTDLVVSTMADGAESDTTPALWGATVVSTNESSTIWRLFASKRPTHSVRGGAIRRCSDSPAPENVAVLLTGDSDQPFRSARVPHPQGVGRMGQPRDRQRDQRR